jgi:hypothetical protein
VGLEKMNIIKSVMYLGMGLVMAGKDMFKTQAATTGSAANIGSFAGAGSINDLIPLVYFPNAEFAVIRHKAEASHKPDPLIQKNKSLITPENAAIWMRVEPSLIWKLVKERKLLTSKRKGRTMIKTRALMSQRIQRLLKGNK